MLLFGEEHENPLPPPSAITASSSEEIETPSGRGRRKKKLNPKNLRVAIPNSNKDSQIQHLAPSVCSLLFTIFLTLRQGDTKEGSCKREQHVECGEYNGSKYTEFRTVHLSNRSSYSQSYGHSFH